MARKPVKDFACCERLYMQKRFARVLRTAARPSHPLITHHDY
jgi:hypothetical protein